MGQLFSSLMQYLFPNKEYKIVMVRASRDKSACIFERILLKHELELVYLFDALLGSSG